MSTPMSSVDPSIMTASTNAANGSKPKHETPVNRLFKEWRNLLLADSVITDSKAQGEELLQKGKEKYISLKESNIKKDEIIKSLNSGLKTATEQHAVSATISGGLKEQLTIKQKKIDTLISTGKDQADALTKLKQTESTLQQQLQTKESELSTLRALQDSSVSELKLKKDELANAKAEHARTQETLTESYQREKKAGLDSQKESYTTEITNLIASHTSSLALVKAEIRNRETEITDKKKELETVTLSLQTLGSSLTEVRLQLKEALTDRDKFKDELQEILQIATAAKAENATRLASEDAQALIISELENRLTDLHLEYQNKILSLSNLSKPPAAFTPSLSSKPGSSPRSSINMTATIPAASAANSSPVTANGATGSPNGGSSDPSSLTSSAAAALK